jgi:hypothetical protein
MKKCNIQYTLQLMFIAIYLKTKSYSGEMKMFLNIFIDMYHGDKYGVQNLCDGHTACSFDVTNSNVGSSCGSDGKASLQVSYNCKRKLYFIEMLIHYS